ncbi:MAG: efflux RND transporter periplasmic adaptor subunit [Imperialibacter sp.]|uniref:efflux RND transporter periplasmic adaptor subunit n=1 Tax=Imperialibacter sp. TaxID=2038411 RepID=UPI0032ECF3A1
MTIDKKTVITGLITLVMGLLIGWLIFGGSSKISANEDHQHSSAEETVWTCSMHPQIRQNEPGQCPICGMDLIPLESGMDEGIDPMAISMSPVAMQLANVSTAVVGSMAPVKSVKLIGKVQADERLIYSQTSHIPGRIEKLLINFTGEYVRKGQTIAFLYSPDLVNAQKELLEASKMKAAQPQFLEAAKEKLRNWKLTNSQIDEILESGVVKESFPLLADNSGYVTNKLVNRHDHVAQGQVIYEIVDLSSVWVLFDVYESDMTWVKKGDKIPFTVASLPGETFSGTISFIDPIIDAQTRVAKARVEVKNSASKLKPEMFVSGTLEANLPGKAENIIVPKTAVMWTGQRSVVYVKVASNQSVSFVIRDVVLGPALGDSYIVKEGLENGEEIAVNGTFSIDAAAQLAGKPSMMNRQPDGKAAFNLDHMVTLTAQKTAESQSGSGVPPAFRNQLTDFAMAYINLKNELVNDDPEKAQKLAGAAKEKLSKIDMKLLSDHQVHMAWMSTLELLEENLAVIANSGELATQRVAFVPLSSALIQAVEQFGVANTTFYQQHCPMADSNKGADWLSLEKEIRNPYYGDAMLSCGSVERTITPVK